ncbi:DUF4013 domain-containing protein [Natronolimnohabitans innermongolicus]|uniref:DUF4013 domain-containing protein n=1 Tax=Natronolimnohabitans innermongolicus JCM 12255 TaxID=1227499 RepID=L9WQ75_9EURY|nr:DUF4013 domain-containing protein [Natronolimnohabitans innermongolicus]ELY51629.1 hypothetical protein C493_16906 [Natronolimnohabitans innermongolicus JCM 12255]
MLTDALTYLKHSTDAWKTTLIGGLFVLLSVFIVPMFFVWGYVVRVLERTARGNDEAPTFDDWRELTVDGAKAVAILAAYALVPIVVGGLLFGGLWFAVGTDPGTLGSAAIAVASLLMLALTITVAYVVPAALARFATEGRLRAGFEFDALRPSLATSTYAVGWLLALGIVFAGSLLAGLLGEVPVVGALLGAIVSFYALVAAYYVVGQTWADLHPVSLEEGREEPSSERPAV